MAGHSGGGIVQQDENHPGIVVQCIDNPSHTRCKEGRVTDKRKVDAIRICPVHPLCHRHTGTHAQAGIDHIQRHCIAQRITSNVTAEIRFFTLHCDLDRIEGSPVRASGTEYRRADRQSGCI